ncbi:MAG TPA: hypothetical protein DDW52_10515 [Planctomycetaceae bacterium]|nr:hypothetical protein [Planctomycetaceae bacterium]
MDYSLFDIGDICPTVEGQWDAIRASRPEYYSPFFSRRFIKIAAPERPQTQVVIASEHERVVGVLPFERAGQSGYPVCRMINDAHGFIGDARNVDFNSLLSAAGVTTFVAHADPNPVLPRFETFGSSKSFLCDLSVENGTYSDWLRSHSKTIAKQRQKSNKLKRELGSLRLDFDCKDHEILDQLINLKSEQYKRTHIFDKFSIPWVRRLMHRLLDQQSDPRLQLSILYAGDQLVAGHYGIREGSLLHYWFPVYRPEFSIYSPGTALFLEIINRSVQENVSKIDFGYGELPYKWKLCNVVTESYEGVYSRSRLSTAHLRARRQIEKLAKLTPGKSHIKRMRRMLFPDADARAHGG